MPTDHKNGFERRRLLSAFGVGAAAVATGAALAPLAKNQKAANKKVPAPVAQQSAAQPKPPRFTELPAPPPAPGPEVAALLGDIAPGSRLDRWSVVAVYDVVLGAIPVVLATADGTRFQVDVVRRDPAVPGLADTRHLSVLLSNHGDGAAPTVEEQGLGAMALAAALAAREESAPAVAGLLTRDERQQRFPRGVYAVPA